MADEHARPRLGRGLAALLGETREAARPGEPSRDQRKVPIEFLRPNPRNPRRHFGPDELEELAGSIRERGIIQPIVVRAIRNVAGTFEIIAGERRWRAAQLANLHEVPVIVVEAGDREALEIAIIENVQRTDLNALEEARGYEQLISQFDYSQNDLAKIIGKSRSHVANTLRLLKLSQNVQNMLNDGELSAGHARALLAFEDPEPVARRIVAQGLNVREVERLAQKEQEADVSKGARPAASRSAGKDADTRAIEKTLTDALGLSVRLDQRGDGGEMRIVYRSIEQLDVLCDKLRS